MKKLRANAEAPTFLGIEGGATHTVALLADGQGRLLRRMVSGPGNIRLLDDRQLLERLRAIGQAMPAPVSLAIGMAGARTEKEWHRMRTAAAKIWPKVPAYATNDLETALSAAGTGLVPDARAQVLVLCGTGSCCYGRSPNGRTAKVGGWGHVLGDQGSAYDIGHRALQTVLETYDHSGQWPPLGQSFLRALLLNEPDDLVGWAHAAQKTDFASLAPEVFAAGKRRDRIAQTVLAEAAGRLANDAVHCARRLTAQGSSVHFVLSGGVLLRQAGFAQKVGRELRRLWPGAVVTPLRRESAWGAVELARAHHFQTSGQPGRVASLMPAPVLRTGADGDRAGELISTDPTAPELSPTEQRNPRSMRLDRLSVRQAITLMLSEDAKIPAALLAERTRIEQAIKLVVRAFRRGGRLIYVGAGTSGRLGVLDASECPPTFCSPPDQVQGVIAGGQTALWNSVEGAEDDDAAGARAISFKNPERRDVVVGIAASGRTPFVWGALAAAKQRGAATILITFNPAVKLPASVRPRLLIAPSVGPEVLTGSTRLKAGTATKLILNLVTTLAMVQLGKVASNLMIDVNPSNTKLQARAVRILRQLTGADDPNARAALERCGWVVREAWKSLSRGY